MEFPARDFDAIQTFYEQAFGREFTDYGPEYRAFTDGNIDGGFYLSELSSSTGTGAVLVILCAADLEQTRDAVLASGGAVLRDIFAFPGGRRFLFADPNGTERADWSAHQPGTPALRNSRIRYRFLRWSLAREGTRTPPARSRGAISMVAGSVASPHFTAISEVP